MNKKQIAQRRLLNQRLAEQDAAQRCGYCKIALTAPTIESPFVKGRFCSEPCLYAFSELQELKMQAGS